jgi:2-polyprenyl-3-methyl-5-hydroxy-6-metoxy-1,4-benzoquinol methylase
LLIFLINRLEDYEAFKPIIESMIGGQQKDKVKILNLGCGNSIMCEEMYDDGFANIYNIDISSVVIDYMKKRN